MRRAARAIAFPGILAVAVGAALALLERGVGSGAILLGITSGVALATHGLERAFPFSRAWLRSHGDLGADVCHLLFSTWLAALPTTFVLQAAAALSSGRFGAGLPLLAQLPLAILLIDLVDYWMHRLGHRVGWMWRLHAVHHSAPRLYWLNVFRFHPLDASLKSLSFVPLVLLGASPELLTLLAVFLRAFAILQHANADLLLGPLDAIFSTPAVHRWHHSRRPEEAKNYGDITVLWDVVFGTRHFPDRAPATDVGIEEDSVPPDYLGQLAAPFVTRRFVTSSDVVRPARGPAP